MATTRRDFQRRIGERRYRKLFVLATEGNKAEEYKVSNELLSLPTRIHRGEELYELSNRSIGIRCIFFASKRIIRCQQISMLIGNLQTVSGHVKISMPPFCIVGDLVRVTQLPLNLIPVHVAAYGNKMQQKPQFKTGDRGSRVKIDQLVVVIFMFPVLRIDAIESIQKIRMIISVKNAIHGFIFFRLVTCIHSKINDLLRCRPVFTLHYFDSGSTQAIVRPDLAKIITPVGSYPEGATPEGLYDMAGNVWEWTDSWYDSSRSYRVLRGGSWLNTAEYCRSAYRNCNTPDLRNYLVGFRLVFVP